MIMMMKGRTLYICLMRHFMKREQLLQAYFITLLLKHLLKRHSRLLIDKYTVHTHAHTLT